MKKKIVTTESGGKYTQNKNRFQAETVQNKYVADFWCERTKGTWSKYYELWTHIMTRADG